MRITKRSVYSGLAGVGVLLGAGGLAAAATGTDAPPVPAVVQQAQPDPTADSATPIEDEANEGLENEANEGSENEANEGSENEGPDTPPTYTSSVQTAPEDEAADAAESEASEAEEDAALAALATVTPEEASAAALAAEPGTVDEVELSNEAGNVVYEVEILTDAGGEMEVVVDAGNGTVLATQAD